MQASILCREALFGHEGIVAYATICKTLENSCKILLLTDSDSVHQGKGTRKNILTRIMVSRSEIDMKQIKEEYKKNYSKTLHMDILVRKH